MLPREQQFSQKPQKYLPKYEASHKFFVVGVLAVVLVFAGVIGAMLWRTWNADSSYLAPLPESAALNWKILKSEIYGFEMKYPSTWEFREGDFSGGIIYSFGTPTVHVFDIGIEENAQVSSICDEGYTRIGSVQVGDRTLDKCKIDEPEDRWSARISNNTNSFVFYCWFDNSDCEKALSTFRFIDSIDTSVWKTYRNEKYGFEFQYPPQWVVYDNDTQISVQKFTGETNADNGYYSIDFFIEANTNNLTAEGYAEEIMRQSHEEFVENGIGNDLSIKPSYSTTINGIGAYKIENIFQPSREHVYITNARYALEIWVPTSDMENFKSANQMLATLKLD